MRNEIRNGLLILTCILLLAGCGGTPSDEIDAGSVDDSIYRNRYFGISITVPDGWVVQGKEAVDEIKSTGAEIVAGDDNNLSAIIEASAKQSVDLLTTFKHPVGAPVEFNPNFASIAEKVGHMPGIKRGEDYLFHSKKLLQSSQLDISFPREVYSEQIDGVEFDILTTEIHFAGQVITQKQYVTIRKGFALGLVLSFTTAEQEAELAGMLESIQFQD